jgi:aspartyl-tRNA(Asn)/glutamyl-tRNA(Gln) amidotransferase subunit C
MKIQRSDVQHVAELARLRFDEEELERFTKQLNDILTFMEKLNELDTFHVPPTTHAMELSNVFRQDRIRESLLQEQALANAPRSAQGSFQVPRVIE